MYIYGIREVVVDTKRSENAEIYMLCTCQIGQFITFSTPALSELTPVLRLVFAPDDDDVWIGTSEPSTDILQTILDKAVETKSSRPKERLIQKPPFNSASFPLWSKKNASKSLLVSVKRGNMIQAFANAQAQTNGFDNGVLSAIAQDKDNSYAICIWYDQLLRKVIEVLQLDEGVPAIVVLYCRGTRDTPANDTIPWVQEVSSKSASKTVPRLQIVANLEEQKLLLAVLNMNARRLSDQF
ncbi:hypothetical protein C8R41DRAFT_867682 [Lentinula lateritia]|uniref:Uncharacterized protein n=1 Tax=Lentinula lateritia TaxID=40482 RepID=A0ABQ8VE05_9AGAR|nr:hypothetical protein C8R41DRAFT_867682 [Lentinula lateritia]